MHSGPQLRERKAKRAAIQASKHWKKVADKRMNKINKLGEMSDEFKDDLTRVTKEMESNHFSVSKSEFSWEFCPERHKQAMLGIMAVKDVAESTLGGCTRNVQTGNKIHLSSAAAVSNAKRNHIFDRSIPSKRKTGDDMKSRGIFLQFDQELQRAMLVVGIQGEWDC